MDRKMPVKHLADGAKPLLGHGVKTTAEPLVEAESHIHSENVHSGMTFKF